MTKKKTEDFEVAMNVTEVNDEEKKEVLNASEELHKEPPIEEGAATAPDAVEPTPKKKRSTKKKTTESTAEVSEEPDVPTVEETLPKTRRKKTKEDNILTIEAGDSVLTDEELAEIAWHEIQNAHRTRKILTGMLGGVELNEVGKTIAIVEYKGYRILIPMSEMILGIQINLDKNAFQEQAVRYNKLLSNMLGADIDFIVKGIDSKTRSVVASRKEAMIKKRKTFYMETDSSGAYKIYDGRIVQARVIAVAEKAIRIEVFGVECTILSRDLSWEWIGDAHERYNVGDEILVRILSVDREDMDNIHIKADVKSVAEGNKRPNLNLCRVQGKYAGKVIDVRKGAVYLRLTNGVNAVAHSCLDRRTPAKRDEVSFAVTRIDERNHVAVGIITRILKQNI